MGPGAAASSVGEGLLTPGRVGEGRAAVSVRNRCGGCTGVGCRCGWCVGVCMWCARDVCVLVHVTSVGWAFTPLYCSCTGALCCDRAGLVVLRGVVSSRGRERCAH